MATKTIQLYFYQEYVRRVGVRFEFDHFDLKRDRIVYRPQVLDLQHRFRSGMTLQSPHLEEAAVFSPSDEKLTPQQVRCTEGRYYTIHNNRSARRLARLTELEPVAEPASETIANVVEEEHTTMADNRAERMSQKRIAAGNRGYHGNKNFLDKSCPIQIRKDGIQELDGTKYCFLQGYPWSLEYQVAYEPFGVPLKRSPKGTSHRKDSINNGGTKKREQFFFDLRADLRAEAQAQARTQAQQQAGTESANGVEGGVGNSHNNSDGGKVFPGGEDTLLQSGLSDSTNSNPISASHGHRYFRALRFECSMNFLDLKRATRNIIGRWLEGKVQRWKKVLGGKKPTIQHHTDVLSDSAEFSSRTTKRKQNRKVIQVIDSILGPPAKPLANLDNTVNRWHPSVIDNGGRDNSDNIDSSDNNNSNNNNSNDNNNDNNGHSSSDASRSISRNRSRSASTSTSASNNTNNSIGNSSSSGSFSVQPSISDFRRSDFSLSTVTAY
ncbi:hypothetical protein BGX26_008051 [Mortierella sp. AD094]|nr:hypothetical protein BGX26_008051 [Mortierella sp. AD094]